MPQADARLLHVVLRVQQQNERVVGRRGRRKFLPVQLAHNTPGQNSLRPRAHELSRFSERNARNRKVQLQKRRAMRKLSVVAAVARLVDDLAAFFGQAVQQCVRLCRVRQKVDVSQHTPGRFTIVARRGHAL